MFFQARVTFVQTVADLATRSQAQGVLRVWWETLQHRSSKFRGFLGLASTFSFKVYILYIYIV